MRVVHSKMSSRSPLEVGADIEALPETDTSSAGFYAYNIVPLNAPAYRVTGFAGSPITSTVMTSCLKCLSATDLPQWMIGPSQFWTETIRSKTEPANMTHTADRYLPPIRVKQVVYYDTATPEPVSGKSTSIFALIVQLARYALRTSKSAIGKQTSHWTVWVLGKAVVFDMTAIESPPSASVRGLCNTRDQDHISTLRLRQPVVFRDSGVRALSKQGTGNEIIRFIIFQIPPTCDRAVCSMWVCLLDAEVLDGPNTAF
ncbi:hypothetical protein F4780DRAFT_594499 [Xylariomycetidae sp. FL0641]|nr:hypothetical protein F4780DRAFT_594499 [Xylariomycetidae sp. FL0641]